MSREHLYHFYPLEQLEQGGIGRPVYRTMLGVREQRLPCQDVSLGSKLGAEVVTSGIISMPYVIELRTVKRGK